MGSFLPILVESELTVEYISLGKSFQVTAIPEPIPYQDIALNHDNNNATVEETASLEEPPAPLAPQEPKKKLHWRKKKALAASELVGHTEPERGTTAELVYSPSRLDPEKRNLIVKICVDSFLI
jgi:hypothetical protein